MTEKDLLIKERVEKDGLLSFKEFYRFAHSWFKDEQYEPIVEEKYQEKMSGGSRDMVIEWRTWKRISEYFQIEAWIKMEIFGMTEVEVEIDGKKKKMNKGRIMMEIKGSLIKDPDSKWDGTAMYRFIREMYDKYVIPAKVDRLEDKIKDDVRDFKEACKSFLELQGRRISPRTD